MAIYCIYENDEKARTSRGVRQNLQNVIHELLDPAEMPAEGLIPPRFKALAWNWTQQCSDIHYQHYAMHGDYHMMYGI